MNNLHDQEPKLKLPKLRSVLIKLHSDLLVIDRHVEKDSAYYPTALTTLEKLVLVLEDRRFINHHGVDLISAFREIIRAMTFRKHGGASTIDMQFVRTATGYKHRTLRRKLYEILLAVIIQFRYSKIVILRSYLACAFFGSQLIGTTSASRKLYLKNAHDLSLEEASVIAAMLVYPSPLLATETWRSRVDRRARYGKRVYIANKKRFDELPS